MPELPHVLNTSFVESLYRDYLRRPESLPAEWRDYFSQFNENGNGHAVQIGPRFKPSSVFNPGNGNGHAHIASANAIEAAEALQDRVDQLVRSFRVRGHMLAQLDPLGRDRPPVPELDPTHNGLTEGDMDRSFSTHTISGPPRRTLREIVDLMRKTYCGFVGVQYMHIDEVDVRRWLQERMEGTQNRVKLSREQQLRIFTRLTDAVIFEEFIQKKYIGAKRFSLEGSESLIPLLELAIEKAGEFGVKEIVMGMAHRGRLNVLCNILGKSPAQIFREFEDVDHSPANGHGDVKYHLGYSSDWTTEHGNKLHLTLCFNPSHLEFVNAVAVGRTRAKQDRHGDRDGSSGMALLIHGDAAFPGQGVVQETLNMSELAGYSVGGAMHIVVNNQIGFTTRPSEARSSLYATGLAKMLQVPIFHVNGENPEAVAQVILLAMEFRRKWRRDVIIDMYCYRRHGHNETDEPSFTDPAMSKAIDSRKSVREGYLEHLLKLGGITQEDADHVAEERVQRLEKDLGIARSNEFSRKSQTMQGLWSGYLGGADSRAPEVETKIPRERAALLLAAQTKLPEGFQLHPKLRRFLDARIEMADGKRPIDWANGEALAFASLLTEGARVRLSGQDSVRGTFSHRHCVFYDYETSEPYAPLKHLAPDQAYFEPINSPLSEIGVLGFDYGYSLDCPDGLILWEAQFGDFVNVAQVIIDQFITSAEDKWQRLSGLVMLLPHGFEGQGPEHSSARMERFLTLAAEDNIQVVYPTTPAQYFHVLRRQVVRKWRKPLVIFTPKSLLRHPKVVSSIGDFTAGRFQRIIPDTSVNSDQVTRVLLCTGKIYYELLARREETKRNDIAIIRVEQLYPLQENDLVAALSGFSKKTELYWVQEEPENMGACRYIRMKFTDKVLAGRPVSFICRPESASPATGSAHMHKIEQEVLMERSFDKVRS